MSKRQKKSLVLLIVFVFITIIGIIAMRLIVESQQRSQKQNLVLTEASSKLSELYYKLLEAELKKMVLNSKDAMVDMFRDQKYIDNSIEPIKLLLGAVDYSIFSGKEQVYIEAIQDATQAFIAASRGGRLNSNALDSIMETFTESTVTIKVNLKKLNAIQKQIINDRVQNLEKESVVIDFISTSIIIVVVLLSCFVGWRLNNQIKLEIKYAETQTTLDMQNKLAKDIQTGLLPIQEELADEYFNVFGYMQTADSVGGDYYDYIKQGDNRWLIIGDVTGHGLTSAVVMLCLKFATNMSIQLSNDTTPDKVLSMINRWVYLIRQRLVVEGEDIQKKTATFLIAKMDEKGKTTYIGQHPEMMVYRQSTDSVEVTESTKGAYLHLGLLDGDAYDKQIKNINSSTIELLSGDKLLLYTDGVTEASRGGTYINNNGVEVENLFDEEGLLKSFKENGKENPDIIVSKIMDSIKNFRIEDDVTMMVVERK